MNEETRRGAGRAPDVRQNEACEPGLGAIPSNECESPRFQSGPSKQVDPWKGSSQGSSPAWGIEAGDAYKVRSESANSKRKAETDTGPFATVRSLEETTSNGKVLRDSLDSVVEWTKGAPAKIGANFVLESEAKRPDRRAIRVRSPRSGGSNRSPPRKRFLVAVSTQPRSGLKGCPPDSALNLHERDPETEPRPFVSAESWCALGKGNQRKAC